MLDDDDDTKSRTEEQPYFNAELPNDPRPTSFDEMEALPGFVLDLPLAQIVAPGALPIFHFHYTSSDMRPCGDVGCHQRHSNGWLIRMPDRRVTRIGEDCGLREFPHLAGLIDEYHAQEVERSKRNAYHALKPQAAGVEAEIDTLMKRMTMLGSRLYTLEEGLPRAVYKALEERARRGDGEVTEERRAEVPTETPDDLARGAKRGSQWVAMRVGVLRGITCLRRAAHPMTLRSSILALVRKLLDAPPVPTFRERKDLLKFGEDLAKLVEQLRSTLDAGETFFVNDVLGLIPKLDAIARRSVTSVRLHPEQPGRVLVELQGSYVP